MGNLNGVEYVDLKLPSGILWAKYNLGAETSLSCGDFFAWGETKPKKRYYNRTYKFCKTIYQCQVLKNMDWMTCFIQSLSQKMTQQM